MGQGGRTEHSYLEHPRPLLYGGTQSKGIMATIEIDDGRIQRGAAAWGVPGHRPWAGGRFMDREAPHGHVDLIGGLT